LFFLNWAGKILLAPFLKIISMEKKSNGFVTRLLGGIERVGNKLPHPGALFALFAVGIIILSGITSLFTISTVHPGTGQTIEPVNLMSQEGLHLIMTNMVTNFTSFAPLGTVLVAMLGIGITEASGLMSTGLRLLVISAPKRLLTFAIVFAGILSNTASEVGYVVLVPLGGNDFSGGWAKSHCRYCGSLCRGVRWLFGQSSPGYD
jgi:aminobenzoyl-glutamate transport protein